MFAVARRGIQNARKIALKWTSLVEQDQSRGGLALRTDHGSVGCRSRRRDVDDRYLYCPRARAHDCIADNLRSVSIVRKESDTQDLRRD